MGFMSTLSGFLPETLPEGAGKGSFYELKTALPKGKVLEFDGLRGKPVLIVNTATRCGLTPQLYKQYHDTGLEVLGFPTNEFAGQSPENDEDGAAVCLKNHGVTFPLVAKSEVNGKSMNNVFAWLKAQPVNGNDGPSGAIKWNFTKFLVDRNGKVVGRYGPKTTPEELRPDIEKLL